MDKYNFRKDYESREKVKKMAVAVMLPSGASEIIINTEDIQGKFEYYMSAYDDDLCLKNKPEIKIVGWLLV